MTGIQARFRFERPGFTLDVDIELPERGVTAVFGPSGCGKTTLLRCIAGLERVSSGRLLVNGHAWQDAGQWMPAYKRPVGYVFQEPSLFPHLTVMGNLRYGMQRISNPRQTRLDQVIDLFGIGHLLDRKPERLSGGERQRVGIARALAIDPALLLMDEPLSALDIRRKREILPYLERLHEELDIPVIYVSHSPDEVARLADHLVAMDEGRVVAQGPITETLARLDLPVRLGDEVGSVLDATVSEIDSEWHLMRVEFAGGSLWARDSGLNVGRRVRIKVLARDISLADAPGQTSIQNVLRGRIDAIGDDEHPGVALVRVKVGEVHVLARITKRAIASIDVHVGRELWVQIKSVALLE